MKPASIAPPAVNPRKQRLKTSLRPCIAFTLGLASTPLLGASGVAGAMGTPGPATVSSAPGPFRAAALPRVAQVAARLRPAVVNISVSGSQQLSLADNASCAEDDADQSEDTEALKNLLRQFQKQFGVLPSDLKVPIHADASGIIIRPDGVILTNAHVVAAAEEISVRLTDHREYRAKVIGIDALADVAVIKVDAEDLPVARLARSPLPQPGEWVVAIGSPFGFESSVTAGVVSAPRRFFPDEGFVPYIQSDVAVNPGSSGGPLVNMRGEVIGINAQFLSRTGNFQGLSFAIPIDIAQRLALKMMNDGEVRHARLGVTVQDLSDPLARAFHLGRSAGALVADVAADSPAGRAGLESGDLVQAVDGKRIEASGELSVAVLLASPGQTMALNVWHRGEVRNVHVRLDEAGAKPGAEGAILSAERQSLGELGMVVSPLEAEDQRRLKTVNGVLIRDASGAAEHAGVRPGDVLLALGAMPIGSIADAVQAAHGAEKTVAALIQHGRDKRYVALLLK